MDSKHSNEYSRVVITETYHTCWRWKRVVPEVDNSSFNCPSLVSIIQKLPMKWMGMLAFSEYYSPPWSKIPCHMGLSQIAQLVYTVMCTCSLQGVPLQKGCDTPSMHSFAQSARSAFGTFRTRFCIFLISVVQPHFQLLSFSLHPSVLFSLKITPGSAAKQRDILIKVCHSFILPEPNHIINISVFTSKHFSNSLSSLEDSDSLNSKKWPSIYIYIYISKFLNPLRVLSH